MNTSVNGRLPVLVWFHGQSYFTLFLLYTTFWFRSTEQNRWRLRFWDHTPVPSRFINEIFSETFYLRIIWISSWEVWILGSVHPVYIQMNSIPLSFKVETKYVVVEISTLVFSVRYSTTVTINIQKAVLLMHPREQHLNGSKDIFVTLVVILGYLIRSFIYIITNVVVFFSLKKSQATIWGQSSGASSVMYHVSCSCLRVTD